MQPVIDPADWGPEDLARDTRWLHRLDEAEIASLRAMAAGARRRIGDDPGGLLRLQRGDFGLGAFEPRLQRIYEELRDGQGVVLIRGLPVAQMDPLEAATIYWGIGRHLGEARSNNPDGDMLGHVTDLGKTQSDPHSRGYQTREEMDYHCDQCDIVGLLCVRTARSGGLSKIASSVRVYNALLAEHPEYVRALSDRLCWTKHGEFDPGEAPFYESAVFNFLDDYLCTSFGPKHIVKGHDLPGTPPLTTLQREAIATAEQFAERHHYAMQLEVGDIQLLNNYVVLHTRTAYQDHDDPARKRLLWRLWLMQPDLRPQTAYARQWSRGVSLAGASQRIVL